MTGLKPGLPVTEVGDEAATVFPGYPVRSGRLVVVAAAAAVVVVVVVAAAVAAVAAAAAAAAAAVEAINSQVKKGSTQLFRHFKNVSSLLCVSLKPSQVSSPLMLTYKFTTTPLPVQHVV